MGYLVLPGESAPDDSSDASSIAKSFRVGLVALALAIATILAITNPVAAGEVTTTLEGNHPDEAADIAESEAPPPRPLPLHLTMAIRHPPQLDRVLPDHANPPPPAY